MVFGRKLIIAAAALGAASSTSAQPANTSLSRLNKVYDAIRDDYVEPVDMEPLAKAAIETIHQKSATDEASWSSCMSKMKDGIQPPPSLSGGLGDIANALICASMQRSPAEVDEIVDDAIRSMLNRLDDRTALFTPADAERQHIIPGAHFGSIGVNIKQSTDGIEVVHAAQNATAAQAGVSTGDIIRSIDGKSTLHMSLDDAVQMLRGSEDTSVSLSIKGKDGIEKSLTIPRKFYSLIDANLETEIRGSTIFIRIYALHAGIADALKKRILDQNVPITSIVLDLRDDSGGLFDQALALADLFLDKAIITSSRGRTERDVETYWSKSGQILPKATVVVLVNKNTAAGAEILAAAIQDNKRGIVLGERTSGSGSVQTLLPIGDRALKLTTSYEFRPNGSKLVDAPIAPDCADPPEGMTLTDYAVKVASGIATCRPEIASTAVSAVR